MLAYGVFEHLSAPKSALYRAIIAAFVDAKATFRLHLRTQDLLERVKPWDGTAVCAEDIDACLRQLCDWGNIESHPDTADARTVEEFLRPRFLYQLSRAGEAAEEAVRHFESLLGRSAQLQTAALSDVRSLLAELAVFSQEPAADEGKVHLTLRNIWTRFGELTSEAQSFLATLQRSIDLRGADLAGLIAYKQKLIDYLDRFIRELVVIGSDIADQVLRIDENAVHRLLLVAARRDLADALDASDDDHARASCLWLHRWEGLCSWFLGTTDSPPLSDGLRARARAAIPALLSAIAGINESRLTRTDRVADLRTLARWFAEVGTDADAHRLWRAAFGLAPARHLMVDDRTLEIWDQQPVPPRTSWLDAPPIVISPRLRITGRHERANVSTAVVDCSAARAMLAAIARDEAEQAIAARVRLTALGPLTLSSMRHLDQAEFQLFLDLLGEVLSRKTAEDEVIETLSADGTPRIRMEPTRDGKLAVIRTTEGCMIGNDCFLLIEESAPSDSLEALAVHRLRMHAVGKALQEFSRG